MSASKTDPATPPADANPPLSTAESPSSASASADSPLEENAAAGSATPASAASQPQQLPGFSLSTEQRETIRQQLLERQRSARTTPASAPLNQPPVVPAAPSSSSGPAAATTATTANAAAEPLIASAVSFLKSPNVQASPWEKKAAFLRQKGLTDSQIATAAARAGVQVGDGGGVVVGSSQPVSVALGVPSPQVMYDPYQVAAATPRPVSKEDTAKNVILAFLLTGGVVTGLVSLFKHLYLPALARFENVLEAHTKKKQALTTAFTQRVEKLGKLYMTSPAPPAAADGDEDVAVVVPAVLPPAELQPPTISSTLRSTIASTDASLAALAAELTLHIKRHSPTPPANDGGEDATAANLSPLQCLCRSTNDLTRLLSQEIYISPSMYTFYSSFSKPGGGMPQGVSEASGEWMRKVAEVKSEIRTFKGMLLSRRNFPTATGA
ncbi:hypothetical protein HDU87_001376 [Geranomyces variabilis]|uniref:Peroxisomal membrane protein PEX14 n=1 Tax=Geranomyces variabilis TaxID=109894 RepID=A0AAD5TQ02_9FUNG|nr:hypothetical protein HDU87_001376 [Geranomyces variabilis]